MPQIQGKVIAITGASSGMGEATARRLAGAGARVVLGARREDRLKPLVDEITTAGGEAVQRRTDVTRRDDLEALVKLARDHYGRLDVMVNNAGIGPISPLDDLRVDEWDAMIDVNLRGVLYGIAAALPTFRAQNAGHMIVVGSTASLRIVPTMAVYAATKAAARVVCEGLRQEAGDALRVTLLTPGYTNTGFADDIADDALRAQIQQGKRTLAMDPDAIARAIAYAIEQPDEVDIGEIVIRPTAQT